MIDKTQYDVLRKRLEMLEGEQRGYNFTAEAIFDDPVKLPHKIIDLSKGIDTLDKSLSSAKILKADTLKITLFKSDKSEKNIDAIYEIRLSQKHDAESGDQAEKMSKKSSIEKSVDSKLNELLEKVTTRLDKIESKTLAGISENEISRLRFEQKEGLVEIKHEREVEKLQQQINELVAQLQEKEEELSDAVNVIGEFEDFKNSLEKKKSLGADGAAILEGVLSTMGPKLKKLFSQVGLDGFLGNVLDDNSPDEFPKMTVNDSDPRVGTYQRIIEFCAGLNDDQLKFFLQLVETIEKDHTTLNEMLEMFKKV